MINRVVYTFLESVLTKSGCVQNLNDAITNIKTGKMTKINFIFSSLPDMEPRLSKFNVILCINFDSVVDEFLDSPEKYYANKSAKDLEEDSKKYGVVIRVENDDAYKFRWHLDFEPSNDKRIDHPVFHFHQDPDVSERGKVLKMNEPRINYAPLDIVLSIHFVLSNFMPQKEYQKIQQQVPTYRNMIKQSIEKYWKPYYDYVISSYIN